MTEGEINVMRALMTDPKCSTCWCQKECDEVNGETLCGVMRMYYITRK